jgi:hypothetical protein
MERYILIVQIVTLIVQFVAVVITLGGLLLVAYQVRSAQRDALMSSLLSIVAEHWMLIEERRMTIRTGELKVHYPKLRLYLQELLSKKYEGNLKLFAEDYLYPSLLHIANRGEEQLLAAIEKEYAVNDLVFNLYEEEYLAGKYLGLASRELWNYWQSYMQKHFQSHVIRNHWKLRKAVGLTFAQFEAYVDENFASSEQHPLPRYLPEVVAQQTQAADTK